MREGLPDESLCDIRDELGGGAATSPLCLDPEKVTFAEMAVRPEEDQYTIHVCISMRYVFQLR